MTDRLAQWDRSLNRRLVLKSMAGAGGLFVVGCGPEDQEVATRDGVLSPFISIAPDNTVSLTPPEAEMGQGVLTSLAQIIADELDVEWHNVRVQLAGHHKAFYDELGVQATGDSNSVRVWYEPLRRIGAAARAVLVQAAAQDWGVEPSSCTTEPGLVVHDPSGRRARYGDLVSAAARLPLPADPDLKRPVDFRLIGQSVPRKDTPFKVDGSAVFGADIRLPNQVYGAVRLPPVFGSRFATLDIDKARGAPGVIDVTANDNIVTAVATSWWRAHQALDLIELRVEESDDPPWSNDSIDAEFNRLLSYESGVVAVSEGALDYDPSARSISSGYAVPYLAHMCMEPMVATVWVKDDAVEAYAPTQSPERFAKRISQWTGVALERVNYSNTFLGCGLGRKGLDFVCLEQATRLSMKHKRPVQVMLDRETDTQHDQFRPAAAYQISAQMGSDGELLSLKAWTSSQSIRRQLFPDYYNPDEMDPNSAYGLVDFFYDVGGREVEWVEAELPVPIGYWRAVGRSNTPFAKESFIDELAAAIGQDPLDYRLKLLGDRERHKRVLQAAADAADWGRDLAEGQGLGIAIQDGWGSICAQVAQVAVRNDELEVQHIWAAVDCGRVISPDQAKAQITSGILDGLGAALNGSVVIQEGRVSQSNFHDYPVMTMKDAPEIDVVFVESNAAPGGVGELGVPAVAPAVANALYAAIGYRARSLPLLPQAPFVQFRLTVPGLAD